MYVDHGACINFVTILEQAFDVVVWYDHQLLTKVWQFVHVLLSLDKIRGMQVSIVIEVEHFENEVCFHNLWCIEKWLIKVLYEVWHEYSFVFLAFTEKVVEPMVQ